MIAFGQIGFWQLLIVLAVLLLLFGSSRLPKMARSLGQSLTEFKRGLKETPPSDEPPKNVEDTSTTADGDAASAKTKSDATSDS